MSGSVSRNYLDPYRYYRELRETSPVHWNPQSNLWTLTRFADISEALSHPALSSHRKPPQFAEGGQGLGQDATVVYDTIASWLLRQDPPEHMRLRRMSAQPLWGCISARAPQRIRKTTEDLVNRVSPLGGMEVISDLACPLSLDAIAAIVGIPSTDQQRFYEWANNVGAAAEASPRAALMASARQSLAAANDYLRDMLRDRRVHPRHDFATALLQAADNEHVTEEEIAGMCMLLLLAGHETATHLVANGILALLQHPGEIRRLQTSPGLWPNAVRELLRFASPLHGVLRTATEDLELGGKLICKGESVSVCLAAGNRDPAVFQNPELLDVGRDPNPHLAFGRGIHYCLGAGLAELVAGIAIEHMLRRFPDLRLATPRVEWQGNYLFRSLRSLPVVF